MIYNNLIETIFFPVLLDKHAEFFISLPICFLKFHVFPFGKYSDLQA